MLSKVDKSWTLFLDRDGVINRKRDNDYVKNWSEFSFIDGAVEAISKMSEIFGLVIVVTNQRGIGRGKMSLDHLNSIHENMLDSINAGNGKIDKIYFCSEISDLAMDRKPNIGMGLKAKIDFPQIEFQKSFIVGDSISDMIFGHNLRMKKVLIGNDSDCKIPVDYSLNSIAEFSKLFNLSGTIDNRIRK